MSKIILCRGIQGSGKSTWAKQWVAEDPEHRVRFNNDDVRNMLGVYWVPSRESIVSTMREAFLMAAISNSYDIVIDNMNLSQRDLDYYKLKVIAYNVTYAKNMVLEFKDFKTPLDVCIARDSKREHPIGEVTIRETYKKYKYFYDKP